jgi:hypothetical protein
VLTAPIFFVNTHKYQWLDYRQSLNQTCMEREITLDATWTKSPQS